jgi:formate dehydrogenase iron-sulfur subunit
MREGPDTTRRVSLPVLSSSGSPASGPDRRGFMKLTGAAMLSLAALPATGGHGSSGSPSERMGVLVDLTECIGCRRCEFACAEANGHPHPPIEAYDDQRVFDETRRPTPDSLSVVNRARGDGEGRPPVHVKIQCMHCEHAPCVSACLVGAMRKTPEGAVTYDASRCIGCRYCMVACPFERLSYEYASALTPRVRKCELCHDRTARGGLPACVEICPVEALTYGPRDELLRAAHGRIAAHPDRYIDHVYGETEGGGTSFLYLADRPFGELGFPTLGPRSRAEMTEAIQHGIFQGFAAPLALFGVMAGLNFITKRGSHS